MSFHKIVAIYVYTPTQRRSIPKTLKTSNKENEEVRKMKIIAGVSEMKEIHHSHKYTAHKSLHIDCKTQSNS